MPFDKCGWEYMFKKAIITFINLFCVVILISSFLLDLCLIKLLHKRTRVQVTSKVSSFLFSLKYYHIIIKETENGTLKTGKARVIKGKFMFSVAKAHHRNIQ